MMLFGSRENNGELSLIVDVGSGSVGVALIREGASPKEKTTLVNIERGDVFFADDLNFDMFLASMINVLSGVLNTLHDKRLGSPKNIQVFLRAPWYAAQVRRVTLARTKEIPITHSLLDDLIRKEITSFKEAAKEKYDEIDNPLEVIEEKTVSLELNGYNVTNPFGNRAKSVSMALYLSMSPRIVIDSIKRAIRHTFSHAKIHIHSYLFSIYVLMRDTSERGKDFLIIDFGGEITELALVRDGIIEQSATFPIGRHTVVRALMKTKNISKQESESLLSLYASSSLSEKEEAAVEEILKKVESDWIFYFRESLTNLSKTLSVPALVYASSDRDAMRFLRNAIAGEDFHQYTSTDKAFDIVSVEAKLFADIVRLGEGVSKDAFISGEAAYVGITQSIEISK